MTREVSGRCSPHFRALRVAALTVLFLAGCFTGPDVGTIYCVTNDNCPVDYVCTDSTKPGGCRKRADVALDGGALDAATSDDSTLSPDGAVGLDAVILLDSGADGPLGAPLDGAQGGVDSLAVDGPTADSPADIPQSSPDSSDAHVSDAPVDQPWSETRADGPLESTEAPDRAALSAAAARLGPAVRREPAAQAGSVGAGTARRARTTTATERRTMQNQPTAGVPRAALPDLARPVCTGFARPVRRRVSCRPTNRPARGEVAPSQDPRAPRLVPIPGLTMTVTTSSTTFLSRPATSRGRRLEHA